ncbi:hypothetical protein TCAL_03463 [Tigriopus californicus]|uniref:LMBR1 domain-containing protein 2 homolog n=2 Tax=Tigriopus californicus TaxID=6832 RepID=A0A553NQ71_TIGCA|nr:hypothetical protein TCAL_03463 [Tigriopus californicus]
MAATTFVLDVLVTLVLSGYLLYHYGDWMRHRVAVTVAVLIAWYFSFMIIFVLPLDVSSTAYRQCVNASLAEAALPNASADSLTTPDPNIITERDIRLSRGDSSTHPPQSSTDSLTQALAHQIHCQPPYSLLAPAVLPDLWKVVYWNSQLLTWLILPLMQSYTLAGEFTPSGKLRSALWDNMIYYTSLLFIALILFVYIALQPDLDLNWERLKAIASSASNTWGLCVLVLMLGYGLIEVPRNLWKFTQKGYQLNRAYFKVAKLMTERTDAEESLDDALATLHAVGQIIGQNDLRRPFVDTIMAKVPIEMMEKIQRRRTEVAFNNDPPDEKTLTKLHRQVMFSLQNHHRTEAQWTDMTNQVFELEDINRNMISNEHVFKHTLSPAPKAILARTVFTPKIEWYWKCLLMPLILRFAAGLAVVMSAIILWSEITFFSKSPPLSLLAVFVKLAMRSYNYFAIEIICFVSICYLCLCAYYTIFKIRVLNYYYLAKNHQSDEYTLLFSGALLCRLTPPLCLNFLSLIHMDSHVIQSQIMETAYTQIMGHMDVISIVSDYFNIYFPIALLALSLCTYFSVGARFLSALGFQQFLNQDSELTLEMVEEGKEHIKREKRRIQRLQESASRRRDFRERFADPEMGSSGTDRSDSGSVNNRFRSKDIVKSGPFRQASSPERSLLANQHYPNIHNSPSRELGGGSASYSIDRVDLVSPMTETIDLNSPLDIPDTPSLRSEVPKNIFDDL